MSPDRRHPKPAGNPMRASDADRDQTIEVLAAASAEGRLGPDEYSERSEAALGARTLGDLARLTGDLPAGPAAAVPAAGPHAAPATRPEKITAVLGNESRKGHWVVPPHLAVRSVLGDCHLEMQEASIGQQVTSVDVTARFGAVTIFVPDGTDVRLTGRAVFSAKSSDLPAPRPGAPVLVVHCDLFCSAVNIRRPDWKMRWRAWRSGA
ncbi:MAG TPA: DUF1707 domain-containing protein [Streptosporangiaceae bacterium]